MERTSYEYDMIQRDKERLVTRKQLKEARARKLFIMKCMVLSVVLIAFIGIYGILVVNADEVSSLKNSPVKYYTSITVEQGDTLWNIADEYRPAECSRNSYIKDIMELNNMGTDTLYAGQNIIVYYMSE
ncbi:MAG: LysM peptidoglycan-binding domain-containing protein [Lachnospira sp.]|nr:LysM peptidoglycan-binding domain-containing protein [Lachnospira sp.]